jgi:hypothetical protein
VNLVPLRSIEPSSSQRPHPAPLNVTGGVHFQDAAESLQAFERANIDWLLEVELDGWNLWHILKKALYYQLKSSSAASGAPSTASESKRRRYWLTEGPRYFADLLRWSVRKKGRAVIISNTVYKRRVDQGRYLDIFLDPLVTSGVVQNYIYVESPANFIFRRPTTVQRDINRDGGRIAVAVLRRLSSWRPAFRRKAALFAQKLRAFLGTTHDVPQITEELILALMCSFQAQRQWYSLVWKILKPSRIFLVDAVPHGHIAAARQQGIPVYEFQHGFFDQNKPDYIVGRAFKAIKGRIAYPDYIAVFGDYFKDLMLKEGFWSESEVLSVGSYLVDRARESSRFRPPAAGETLNVLWATQSSVHAPMQAFLEGLLALVLPGVKIFVRTHPLEPRGHCEWYAALVQRRPDLFVADDSGDIFQALQGKHLLVGYHSTTLIEGLALGLPVVTIGTERFQRGMNDLLVVDVSDVIKPVASPRELASVIQRLQSDEEFAGNWARESWRRGAHFYAADYNRNVARMFADRAITAENAPPPSLGS